MGYTEKIVVIGAGISGLACAFRLKQLGLQPLVLEASGHAGGVIQTVRRSGFLFEAGPQCPRFPEPVWRLVHELNLQSEFVAGDKRAKRYIVKHGRLHLAPFSPGAFLASDLVDLSAKFRFLTDVFGHSAPPASEETLAEFVERKFGANFLDYLVDPFVSTIFFGDARKMGMESAFPALVEWERNHGSLMRGAIRSLKSRHKTKNSRDSNVPTQSKSDANNLHLADSLPSLGSFRMGMAELPERLAERLKEAIRYGQRVKNISPARGESGALPRGWEIELDGGERITAGSVVLAVPAYAAAGLLEKSAPELASLLNAIEYAPFCAVSCVYDRSSVAHHLKGFGFMVPRREGLETICTFWNSSLFPGRAPEGKVLITSFAGREAGSKLYSASEEECALTVEAENEKILGITGRPVDRMVWRDLRALPQYNIGHARRVTQITEALRALPNLHLAGNFLNGRSLGDCVQIGSQVAERVHSQFGG